MLNKNYQIFNKYLLHIRCQNVVHLTIGWAETVSSLGPVKQQNIKWNQISLNRTQAQQENYVSMLKYKHIL